MCVCDLILENHRCIHISQNLSYGFFVVGRDRRMDWQSFSFISYIVWGDMGDTVVKIRTCE